jgi:hypothetical protein
LIGWADLSQDGRTVDASRVYRPYLLEAMCTRSPQQGRRHFLYGRSPRLSSSLPQASVSILPPESSLGTNHGGLPGDHGGRCSGWPRAGNSGRRTIVLC